MKATEKYFPVVLYKVFLTFESAGEILKCDHSNESYSTAQTLLWCCLSCSTRWFNINYIIFVCMGETQIKGMY